MRQGPDFEKTIQPEVISSEWEEAFKAVPENELMEIVRATSSYDRSDLESYLRNNPDLSSESKKFVELSIQLKRADAAKKIEQ